MPIHIAYFSMEIAVHPRMPTYSGGLGILAGDMLRGCVERQLAIAGVTLLYRKGYFHQKLDAEGRQTEEPDEWRIESFLQPLEPRTEVNIEGRAVQVRAWQYEIQGHGGHIIPVYFLDTNLEGNTDEDRRLTDYLYGGDLRYRLCQEAVLGIGGVRMLAALGHDKVERFHMNEGHAALLALELMRQHAIASGRNNLVHDDLDAIRERCVFTTHTPVPAGHDQFPMELVQQVLSDTDLGALEREFCWEGKLNMTFMALAASQYVNGVAKSHAEVSREMFPSYEIKAITNGIHAPTWVSQPFRELFDKHIPSWHNRTYDTFSIRHALSIPREEIWGAHARAKAVLLDRVNRETHAGLVADTFTIGFARRCAEYKRPLLLFHDLDRLKAITAKAGKFQVIYAGKAHPHDDTAKELIQKVFAACVALRDHIKVVYLANYDWTLATLVTAGVDLWLNTPQPPQEASGTSGMKAALNGVPSLSVLDGWWQEGCIEGKTGWAIDPGPVDNSHRTAQDASALYDKLERIILPLYYQNRSGYVDVMTHAIALNGSFFSTQRMVLQYVVKAYFH